MIIAWYNFGKCIIELLFLSFQSNMKNWFLIACATIYAKENVEEIYIT